MIGGEIQEVVIRVVNASNGNMAISGASLEISYPGYVSVVA